MKYTLIVLAIALSSCTYNVTQQQIGTRPGQPATQGASITNDGVSAGQTLGNADPPLSTYPEYNGYPGSGRASSRPSSLNGWLQGLVQISVGPGYGETGYGYAYPPPPGTYFHSPPYHIYFYSANHHHHH
jgi:hypothetical protein